MSSPVPTRRCPKCAGEVRDGWRVCPACAIPLEAETKTVFTESSSTSAEEGRFPAGTVLAGRYRILGLIGQGGMGEVYRAFDLILNQTVALKFLAPQHLGEAALIRFRNEVRIARQVSHPNVCRVYDLGMVEGLHFLSMEYIDGEDLGSLLRRIGRLPQDKAIEFTRKICAGLSAAHDRGVLHRDLKPSNIMIDGRGQVRITDFGLAALAAEIPLSDLRSGTPAYMSPEQKAGKEVTSRSDLYSLGLVLHEMFTGKRRGDSQSSPSELVKDLDPTVERVILRCLEEDPKRRPSSALSVAMALPGGDPIAAALAAGDTPSPEMVAASQEKEGFSPRSGIACFAVIVISLAVGAQIAPHSTLAGRAPLDLPPDALAFKAQELLRQLGYSEPPRRTAYGFGCCPAYFPEFLDRYEAARRDAVLASHQPPVAYFWYRQHRSDLLANEFIPGSGATARVTLDSPPNTEPGMIRMILDPRGRLVGLDVRPWNDPEAAANVAPNDGTPLFHAAGLDPARFQPTPPQEIPPMAIDDRLAWLGTYSSGRQEPVRVEAAFWRGRPVFLDVGGFEDAAEASQLRQPVPAPVIVILLIFLAGAALTSRRNLSLGRGDRGGAAKLAAGGFLIATSGWAVSAHHVARAWEIAMLIMALSWAAFAAGLLWTLYVAIEPHVRRNWPDSLISWTRFYTGQFRNSLVGSHVLAGIAAAVGIEWLVYHPLRVLLSAPPEPSSLVFSSPLSSLAGFLAVRAYNGLSSVFIAMGFLLLVVLVRSLVRWVWVADLLTCLILASAGLGSFGGGTYRNVASVAFFAAVSAFWLWMFRRFGLLSLLTIWVTLLLTRDSALAFSSWFSGWMLGGQLLILGVAAWALWVILSAQRRPATESAG